MKVKLFNKFLGEFNNVYFSSDLHLNHEAVIKFGRKFNNVAEMNHVILTQINTKIKKEDLLVLLGDTIMINKDYNWVLDSINCKNIIMLYGNHCNRIKIAQTALEKSVLFHGDYVELSVNNQKLICSHYPIMHWNYQDEDSIMLHGHLHGDEPSEIIKAMHQYKCMDVGIDAYYRDFGYYDIYGFHQIIRELKGKKVVKRH